MTPSELKYQVESRKTEPCFFSRSTMKFFGDRMSNYGVRQNRITFYDGETIGVWELYRKHPVKHGLSGSAYFELNTFIQRFPAKGE